MSIENTYLASQTAQISYIDNLIDKSTGKDLEGIINSSNNPDITSSQAQYFADNYTVIARDDKNVINII